MRKMHLAGITATPENGRLLKTALGAEFNLPWDYHADGVAAAQMLLVKGLRLWALEQDARAEPLDQIRREEIAFPTVLVVGNEISGVDPGILELCERVIYLPMYGSKRSLNVAVAFAIAAYELTNLAYR
jgi:tRNA G18 (ribose-2'-O)-methylase SpoU